MDAGETTISYTYDCVGRLLQEEGADGIITTYCYDNKNYLTAVTLTSPLGEEKTYSYTYDMMGRVTSVTDPAGTVSSETYDSVGNVTSVTYPMGGGITYEYDSLGRLTEERLSIGTKKTYTYNADGVLSEYTNGRNEKTTYTYDSLGRVTAVSDEAGTIRYTYDPNGNVVETAETDSSGVTRTITRTYDCMNRVTAVTDYRGDTVKYGYDELGNLISITYAGGEIVRYAYYPDGSLRSVTDGDGLTTAYTYDKRGYLLTTQKPDGSVESCAYDDTGRLSVQTVEAHGEILEQYSYTYDQWGNISGVRHIAGGSEDTDTVNETVVLTSTEMTYDEANRMVTWNGEEVLYDADGNMVYGPVDGQMRELTYDCRKRLIQAGNITYTYDAENVRIGVETEAYTESYTVDRVSSLTQVLEIERIYKNEGSEGDDADSATGRTEKETYYYGNGLVYEKSSDKLFVYHYNHLGSTTLITDRDGNPVRRFSYGTYGELLNREDASTIEYGTIRFLYNGQLGVVTDDNGFYYMRARYYNPDIKRFINQDILTGNIGNSASLNRYSYVEGNPVSYTDPFGLAPFDFVTDKIDVSTIIHAALDILGTLPGGDVFDIINAGVYLMEGNYKEAIKSLIFAVPGMDLAGKSAKYATKGGKYATAAAEVLNKLNTIDKLACVYYAASDFGKDMAYIIYKYGYEKAAFSAETWAEMLSLTAHAIQLGHYSNPFMDTDLTPYIEDAWNELNQNNKGFIDFGSGESGNGTGLAQYGDNFGKMGTYVENPNIKVDWSQYAEHGLERMQQRGMTQEMVDQIVANGKVLSQSNGNKYAFITRDGVVVVSKHGKLITTWSSEHYDSAMQEIILKLFGE